MVSESSFVVTSISEDSTPGRSRRDHKQISRERRSDLQHEDRRCRDGRRTSTCSRLACVGYRLEYHGERARLTRHSVRRNGGGVTEAELFQSVIEVAPGFEAVRADHLLYFGQLLPHLLMGDLLRYVSLGLGEPDSLEGLTVPPTEQEVNGTLAVLDRGLAEGVEATENAVAASTWASLTTCCATTWR
jgi:hypothetical protein